MKRLFSTIAALAAFAGLSASPALATDYALDTAHTFAHFSIHHLGAGFSHGRFNKMEGSLTFDEANLAASRISVTIDAASVDSNHPKRDEHLRSPDFFNVKQFPKITFESTAWKKTGDKTFEVTGNLTLLGQTRPVTVMAVHTGTGKGFKGETLIGFDATFTIDRTAFGMSWKPEVVSKDVKLSFSFEGVAK
jgi:polyisoprenoid-binding protein YceI